MYYFAHISQIPNFYYAFQNQISMSLKFLRVIIPMFKKTFLHMYYLAHISHIPNFYYAFQNQISTSLKSFGVLLRIFRKPFRYLCFISHTSYIFQTFSMHSKIQFLPLLSHLECFYACLWSFLGTYILSRTSRTF